jgi:hypothetical protein
MQHFRLYLKTRQQLATERFKEPLRQRAPESQATLLKAGPLCPTENCHPHQLPSRACHAHPCATFASPAVNHNAVRAGEPWSQQAVNSNQSWWGELVCPPTIRAAPRKSWNGATQSAPLFSRLAPAYPAKAAATAKRCNCNDADLLLPPAGRWLLSSVIADLRRPLFVTKGELVCPATIRAAPRKSWNGATQSAPVFSRLAPACPCKGCSGCQALQLQRRSFAAAPSWALAAQISHR